LLNNLDRVHQLEMQTEGRDSPKLDPKRIINESANFLKEREPEMSAEEYALYERVVTMLTTRPEFALKLLEAMINEKEPPSPPFSSSWATPTIPPGTTRRPSPATTRP